MEQWHESQILKTGDIHDNIYAVFMAMITENIFLNNYEKIYDTFSEVPFKSKDVLADDVRNLTNTGSVTGQRLRRWPVTEPMFDCHPLHPLW